MRADKVNTGYAKIKGKFVFVWVLGINASSCKALVTDDEMGLQEEGKEYRYVVDVLDLFLEEDEKYKQAFDDKFQGSTPDDLEKLIKETFK